MKYNKSLKLVNLAQNQESYALKYCSNECYSYHVSWPYLRAVDLVGGVESDKEQLETFLKPLLNTTQKLNILIAASADSGLLSLLLSLNHNHHKITVVDRCSTPLNSCKDIVSDDIDFEIVQSDLLEYSPTKKFDIILCHSLLSFFTDENRKKLLKKISSWMKISGNFIIAVRLKNELFQNNLNISTWIDKKQKDALSKISESIELVDSHKEELSENLENFYKITSTVNLSYTNISDITKEFYTCNLSIQKCLKGGIGKSYISNIDDNKENKTSGVVLLVKPKV